jgi:hypothetical protein
MIVHADSEDNAPMKDVTGLITDFAIQFKVSVNFLFSDVTAISKNDPGRLFRLANDGIPESDADSPEQEKWQIINVLHDDKNPKLYHSYTQVARWLVPYHVTKDNKWLTSQPNFIRPRIVPAGRMMQKWGWAPGEGFGRRDRRTGLPPPPEDTVPLLRHRPGVGLGFEPPAKYDYEKSQFEPLPPLAKRATSTTANPEKDPEHILVENTLAWKMFQNTRTFVRPIAQLQLYGGNLKSVKDLGYKPSLPRPQRHNKILPRNLVKLVPEDEREAIELSEDIIALHEERGWGFGDDSTRGDDSTPLYRYDSFIVPVGGAKLVVETEKAAPKVLCYDDLTREMIDKSKKQMKDYAKTGVIDGDYVRSDLKRKLGRAHLKEEWERKNRARAEALKNEAEAIRIHEWKGRVGGTDKMTPLGMCIDLSSIYTCLLNKLGPTDAQLDDGQLLLEEYEEELAAPQRVSEDVSALAERLAGTRLGT